MDDPFPSGGICFLAESEEVVNKEYPAEGLSRLPLHPELEHKAKNNGQSFGMLMQTFDAFGELKFALFNISLLDVS